MLSSGDENVRESGSSSSEWSSCRDGDVKYGVGRDIRLGGRGLRGDLLGKGEEGILLSKIFGLGCT